MQLIAVVSGTADGDVMGGGVDAGGNCLCGTTAEAGGIGRERKVMVVPLATASTPIV
ncbi:MAG: hypothetical protein U0105_00320 [Candidatus Obscuribacterales bacterium]